MHAPACPSTSAFGLRSGRTGWVNAIGLQRTWRYRHACSGLKPTLRPLAGPGSASTRPARPTYLPFPCIAGKVPEVRMGAAYAVNTDSPPKPIALAWAPLNNDLRQAKPACRVKSQSRLRPTCKRRHVLRLRPSAYAQDERVEQAPLRFNPWRYRYACGGVKPTLRIGSAHRDVCPHPERRRRAG